MRQDAERVIRVAGDGRQFFEHLVIGVGRQNGGGFQLVCNILLLRQRGAGFGFGVAEAQGENIKGHLPALLVAERGE